MKIVLGVGINDAEYKVTYNKCPIEITVSGNKKREHCPYYRKWKAMLSRCYSEKSHNKYPTYKECVVCEDWLLFSNFRKWMITQEWEGLQLDKDLLVFNNKVYSPETCVFIHRKVNNFLEDSIECHTPYWSEERGKYTVSCRDPMGKHSPYLGRFTDLSEAEKVYKDKKYEYACALAGSEYVADDRVAEALRKRYKKLQSCRRSYKEIEER